MHIALITAGNDHAKAIMLGAAVTTGVAGGVLAVRLRPARTPWPSGAAVLMAIAAYQLVTTILWSIDGAADTLHGTNAAWFVAQTTWSALLGFAFVVWLAYVVANRIGARIRRAP